MQPTDPYHRRFVKSVLVQAPLDEGSSVRAGCLGSLCLESGAPERGGLTPTLL